MTPPARPVAACLVLAAFACTPPARAWAAAPVVDYLYPAGGRQGTTVTVAVGAKADKADAKLDPWPAKAWSDCAGLKFTPSEENGKFRVEIAKDAPPGPHLVRVYNDDGASAPRVFVVGRHREDLEKEPNDDPSAAQAVEELPAVIEGRLEKNGDADSFAVQAEAGRWIVAELECKRLGSPADAALHLLDPDGTEVAFNHDTFGMDPLLVFRAPRSGRYVLQVVGFTDPPGAEVRFSGSKATVYRLSVTTGPYARLAFPPCVRRGGKARLRIEGWNLPETEAGGECVEVDRSAMWLKNGQAVVAVPDVQNVLCLPVVDVDPTPEAEPNDEVRSAHSLGGSALVAGRIDRPGDTDRFSFTAKKDERVWVVVRSAELGFPLDPVVTISDAGGKQLAGADDESALRDPKLEWTAPADGTYVVGVSDLNRAGGSDYVYLLELRRGVPDFQATVAAHSFKVEEGKPAEVKVNVTRQNGYSSPLGVIATGLPDGVTATSPEVPAGGGAVTVTLTASPAAKPGGQPFRISVVSLDEASPAVKPAAFALPDGLLVQKTDALWLTVAKAPATTQPAAK